MNGSARGAALFACTLSLVACNASGSSMPQALPSALRWSSARAAASPIRHVVFVIQENRSFNNLFMGYPGATTRSFGYDSGGDRIRLHAQDLATLWDIDHSSRAFFTACDGTGRLPGTHCKMDGWNSELAGLGAPKDFAYAYTPRSEVAPYWQIAKEYVLADRTFASNLDGSFIAHQYSVAAYAGRGVDFPVAAWGCEGGSQDTLATLTDERTYGPSIVACFDNPTIADEADRAGLRWRFYTGAINEDGGVWSTFQADRRIYEGPDWKTDVVNPPSRFLTDVAAGKLANVTWVTPTDEDSDHPGLNASGGPAWVASLVDAIGESKFWKTTAIFVVWDDWGGWFDPVKPVHVDYDGLGFRVPLLIVSPYTRRGHVSHVQYETASVLRFIEDTFGLAPLAAADARANDPASDAFDFDRQPRPFKAIEGSRPAGFWIRQDRQSRFLHGKPPAILGDD
jgi:phospholipase C